MDPHYAQSRHRIQYTVDKVTEPITVFIADSVPVRLMANSVAVELCTSPTSSSP